VPPAEEAALEEALLSLIEDPPLREEYGARARERALEYPTSRMARSYLDAYAAIAALREARAA
jgi:glycosyltransferase involved in cell wall biosynthesis